MSVQRPTTTFSPLRIASAETPPKPEKIITPGRELTREERKIARRRNGGIDALPHYEGKRLKLTLPSANLINQASSSTASVSTGASSELRTTITIHNAQSSPKLTNKLKTREISQKTLKSPFKGTKPKSQLPNSNPITLSLGNSNLKQRHKEKKIGDNSQSIEIKKSVIHDEDSKVSVKDLSSQQKSQKGKINKTSSNSVPKRTELSRLDNSDNSTLSSPVTVPKSTTFKTSSKQIKSQNTGLNSSRLINNELNDSDSESSSSPSLICKPRPPQASSFHGKNKSSRKLSSSSSSTKPTVRKARPDDFKENISSTSQVEKSSGSLPNSSKSKYIPKNSSKSNPIRTGIEKNKGKNKVDLIPSALSLNYSDDQDDDDDDDDDDDEPQSLIKISDPKDIQKEGEGGIEPPRTPIKTKRRRDSLEANDLKTLALKVFNTPRQKQRQQEKSYQNLETKNFLKNPHIESSEELYIVADRFVRDKDDEFFKGLERDEFLMRSEDERLLVKIKNQLNPPDIIWISVRKLIHDEIERLKKTIQESSDQPKSTSASGSSFNKQDEIESLKNFHDSIKRYMLEYSEELIKYGLMKVKLQRLNEREKEIKKELEKEEEEEEEEGGKNSKSIKRVKSFDNDEKGVVAQTKDSDLKTNNATKNQINQTIPSKKQQLKKKKRTSKK